MNDLSSIDKICPDNAVCPMNGGATTILNPSPFFGEQYFARFDLRDRVEDPLAVSGIKGVCDCAFGENGVIVDQCAYARCLAYASLIENKMTCNTNLVKQCLDIKATDKCSADPTLDCTNKDIILLYPPNIPGECPTTNQVVQNSESNDASISHGSLILMTVLVILSSTYL
jgi:hypothetical protein